MLRVVRQAGLVVPTVLTIAGLVILVGLGTWQWQRKAWKESLIERLVQSASAKPVLLNTLDINESADLLRFRRVRVTGKFADPGQPLDEFHVWTPNGAESEWRIISPFQLREPLKLGDKEFGWVLVIRGRVDDAHKLERTREKGQVTDETEIIGRLRFASTNWATPKPDFEKNAWYALDLDGMLKSGQEQLRRRGAGTSAPSNGLPFFVEAEKAAAAPPAPQPNLKSIHLKNRHLEYAITWWGLAFTLIGVYIVFVFGRLKARISS